MSLPFRILNVNNEQWQARTQNFSLCMGGEEEGGGGADREAVYKLSLILKPLL